MLEAIKKGNASAIKRGWYKSSVFAVVMYAWMNLEIVASIDGVGALKNYVD